MFHSYNPKPQTLNPLKAFFTAGFLPLKYTPEAAHTLQPSTRNPKALINLCTSLNDNQQNFLGGGVLIITRTSIVFWGLLIMSIE